MSHPQDSKQDRHAHAARPVLLDWETRSHADLKTRGGPAYVAHETTEVLCGAAILPDGREFVWSTWPFTPPAAPPGGAAPAVSIGTPYPPQEVLAACAASGVAAHNAEGFDRLVWEALGLPPVAWLDTAPRARRRGLPGSLEGACQAALGVGKDKAGSKVMLKLSVPQKGRLLAPVPLLLSAVVRYCLQDVRVLARLCDAERLFEPHVDDPALDLDTRVNRRGIELDVEWVEGILRELRAQRLEALDRARAALASAGWEAPQVDGDPVLTFLRSPSQLLPYLRRHGAQVGDVQASTMRDLLAHPSPVIAALADARLAVARVTAGKLQRMLDHATGSPPRLTHLFAYHSAHTGRWGGRGPQPQNLPGLNPALAAATPQTAREAARSTGVPLAAVLGGLVKKALVPGAGRAFVMLDLASVEARGVLWLAGDQEGLDRFRAGDQKRPDGRSGLGAYEHMAARLWSIDPAAVTKPQRQVGKATVLSCGFSGGAPALLRGALKGGLTEAALRAAGVDPETAVETWRDAHPLVAGERTGGMFEKRGGVMAPARRGGLWKALLRRARQCVEEGRPGRTHGIRFDREGDHLIVTLPSGRPLVYRNVSLVDRVPPWGGPPKATICWRSPRGPKFMSPSVLVENVVQALCRDLFVHGLLVAEAHGLEVTVHVHDGVAFSVPEGEAEEAFALATQCMQHLPAWAEEFPLVAEGGVVRRFE